MGADLYRKPAYDAAKKQLAAKHGLDEEPWKAPEGAAKSGFYEDLRTAQDDDEALIYFRDSYNDSSVLWQLGLSWWQDVGNILDDDGNLKGQPLRDFRERVATLPLKQDGFPDAPRYFVEKRARLLAFLDRAIAEDGHIYCSV